MRFASIPGHIALKQHLIQAIRAQRVSHAQLFWGPDGGASLSLVLACITYLHCTQRSNNDACGTCPSCQQMHKLVHPSVQLIFPTSSTQQLTGKDAVSSNCVPLWRRFVQEQPYGTASDWALYLDSGNKPLSIGREEARQVLQNVSLKAFNNQHKVILIWLPEYFHSATANALLKVIEEPPAHTHFLLVSHAPHQIINTIRSRTQQIYVPPFTDEEMRQMLKELTVLEEQQTAQLVLLAEGNFSQALKLINSPEPRYLTLFQSWMRLCYTGDLTELVVQAEDFHQKPKVEQAHFLLYGLHLLREAMVGDFVPRALTRVTEPEKVFTQNLRKTVTQEQLGTWIAWLDQAHTYLERNVNAKMMHLALSLRIAQIFQR